MTKQNFDNGILAAGIAALLKEGHPVTIPINGISMEPFLKDGRDYVTLRLYDACKLKRGDVVLARSGGNGHIVLHRIVSRKGNLFILQGDGNPLKTEKARIEDIIGKAVSVTRKGKQYSTTGFVWHLYSAFLSLSSPYRRFAKKAGCKLAYMEGIVKGHRKGIFLNCLAGIFSVALSLLFVYLSKQMIDTATGHPGGGLSLHTYATMLILTIVLQLLCDAADSYISVRVQIQTSNELRRRVFSRILQSEWSGQARFHTGDMVNRIESDTSTAVILLTSSLPSFTIMGVQLAATMAFFFCLDTWLPLIIAGVFPILLIGGKFYLRRMYRYTKKIRQTDSRIQSIIQESLQQRTIIKALEQDERHIGRLDEQQKLLKKRLIRRTNFSISSRTCIDASFACGYLIAFLWGIAGLSDGSITFGIMAAFLQLVGKIQRPLLGIARLVPSVGEALASVGRLHEIESIPSENKGETIRFHSTPDIIIDNISFHYPQSGRQVFKDFSYRIEAGSRLAVTGQTGQGKTTLARLLLALTIPDKGSIRLCSEETDATASPETRCNFTYVPQGNTLFSGSIRENLLMGKADATEHEMRAVLHTATADFVFSMPEGIDSTIGEQGHGLSEGQAQRIAIARALLRDSHIFLFDEATSALDEDTERRLMDNLDKEYAGKTFIFITHHPAVSARCGQTIHLG